MSEPILERVAEQRHAPETISSRSLALEQKPEAADVSAGFAAMWQSVLDLVSADVGIAALGRFADAGDTTLFGVPAVSSELSRADATAILGLARREIFSRPLGSETAIIGGKDLERLAKDAGLHELIRYSELAVCRIDVAGDERFVAAFLGRETRPAGFFEDTVSTAAAVLHHCCKAQQRLTRIERQRRLAVGALRSLSLPVIVLDRSAIVRYANVQGAALLNNDGILRIDTARKIHARRNATTRLIHEAIGAKVTQVTDHVCSLVSEAGERIVLAIRCLPSEDGFDGGAVISAFPSGAADEATADSVFEAFGLIKSEARFLTSMVETGAPSEAAVELGLSKETGKTYTKRVLARLDLKNQFELGQFAGRFVAPFREFGRKGSGQGGGNND